MSLNPTPHSKPAHHSPHWRSFWMGGYEGADHVTGSGVALDMVRDTGHLARLDEDHANAARLGIRCVRESIGWRLAEHAPGQWNFERTRVIADSARRHGLQVLWTLMHYGTPPDVSLLDDGLIDRFAAFAAAVAAQLKNYHDDDEPPVYNLVNEIGFVSWVASSTNDMHPYRGAGDGRGEDSRVSGYEIKRRLVRAVLAGMAAVRRVDPRARFMHVEPVIHTVAPPGRPDLDALAAQIAGYQWQAWDLIAGRMEPELGGAPEALDIIGINHYHSGQWEVETERRLRWHEHDPRRKPMADLLGQVWQRYRRPLLIAETSHFGIGRADWLHDIAHEVRRARAGGVPVGGVCLYPLVDRFDWNDPAHWHHSGLWEVPAGAQGRHDRRLCAEYAQALESWQRCLPEPMNEEPPNGAPMDTLIVFSHLRWNFVYQRPQHIMVRLAQRFRVLFVEEPVRSDGPPRLVSVPKGPNLQVLVPHTPIEAPGFHDEQLSLLQPLLAEHLEAGGAGDCIAWFYTPMALPLIARVSPKLVVYDCMDELSAFKDAPRQLRQRESALMAMAAHVFTGGPSLYEARRGQHPHVHCLPSAVDAAHFNPAGLSDETPEAAAAHALQAAMPRPRLGFFGVIDERMDLALVDALAKARPQWQLVMAGPVVKIDPACLPRHPNIHWLGMQPYERLPYLLKDWDVALMPFALNEATRFISPTKTLEYMAGGKPVVSTAVRDVVDSHGDTVFIGHDTAGFITACGRALAEGPFERARREAAMAVTVSRSSWDRVAGEMARLIDEALAQQGGGAPRAWLDVAAPLPDAAPAEGAGAGAAAASTRFHGARQVKHLIIGAGPTGLAAALELGGPAGSGGSAHTLLVEREDRVGGWCRSVEQGGFTFDHAGHIMFSNDQYVLDLYQRLLGDNLHWQNREAWVWTDGVYTRYPFQGSLYGLPPKVLTECLVGAIEARFGPLAAGAAGAQARPVAPPANFEEFILRVWGEGIARHFALPYNRKLWSVPLSEMETSWLGGRVPLPDLKQMIEGAVEPVAAPMGPNARFGYPLRGGFQALMDGFLPLLNCDLALKSQVLRVSPASRTVRLDDGRLIHYGVLVSTMPLPRLVEACADEAPPQVREAATRLRHVAVRCVNLGVGLAPGQEKLTDKHWVYYAGDSVFHRIFVQGNASPHNSPPGTCGITCEITYAPSKPLPCDGEALIQRAIADCRRVGMINDDNPVLVANQVDMPAAYVIYDHQRAANVKLIRDWFSQHGIVLAGRYAEWEYYNSDHAFLAGRKAAAEVRRRLAEGEGAVAAAIGASATVA